MPRNPPPVTKRYDAAGGIGGALASAGKWMATLRGAESGMTVEVLGREDAARRMQPDRPGGPMRRLWPTLALLVCVACAPPGPAGPGARVPSPPVTTASGLVYRIMQPGTGPVASVGKIVSIHEVTSLEDGTVIMDTWAINHPLQFELGGGKVIDGLDEGVRGMRVGEHRRLTVPPSLNMRDALPPGSPFGPDDTIYFDVVLLQVLEPQAAR